MKARVEGAQEQERLLDCELQDSLALMELEPYIQDLEATGHGKRAKQIDQIKEEIRFPWLDLRRPLSGPTHAELFTLLTGETDHTLHVGLKIGCTIERVVSTGISEMNGNPRMKAQAKTDSGLRATIPSLEAFEDKFDAETQDLAARLPPGSRHMAVVLAVDKRYNNVVLSVRPKMLSTTEDYWMKQRLEDKYAKRWFTETAGRNVDNLFIAGFQEEEALNVCKLVEERIGKEDSAAAQHRNIHHPLFKNVSYKKAEEELRVDGAVMFRPSNKPDMLGLSWAVRAGKFVHLELHEADRPATGQLGSSLTFKQPPFEESYEDLDQVHAEFIGNMNIFVDKLLNHFKDASTGKTRSANFCEGNFADVRAHLLDRAAKYPMSMPWCVSYCSTAGPGLTKDGKEATEVKPGFYAFKVRPCVFYVS